MNVYLSYCAICAAAMLIPGPDTFVVLRTSLAGGAGAGISAAAGSAFGNLLWGGAAALGLATLLTGAPVTLAVLKAAGAAYLLVLGTATLVAARNGTPLAGVSAGAGATAGRKAFRTGLVSDLANVKVGLFWIALLPQFVQPSAEPALASAMVLTMVVIVFVWLSAYARLAARLRRHMSEPRTSRAVNGAVGLMLTGFALVLLGEALGL